MNYTHKTIKIIQKYHTKWETINKITSKQLSKWGNCIKTNKKQIKVIHIINTAYQHSVDNFTNKHKTTYKIHTVKQSHIIQHNHISKTTKLNNTTTQRLLPSSILSPSILPTSFLSLYSYSIICLYITTHTYKTWHISSIHDHTLNKTYSATQAF